MAGCIEVLDFHCHHVPAGVSVTAARSALPSQKARWEKTARLVGDEGLLMAAVEAGDIAGRVVSTPPGHIGDDSGKATVEQIRRLNDAHRELVGRRAGHIFALATVDAYDGETAAREVERAVGILGFKGIFVECSKGDLLIDAPQARPTLVAAAEFGVPVFVHPVNPQPLFRQMEPYGRKGTLFARGTVNGAALIALLEGGVFGDLPGLKVVVTTLAFGGLAMAATCDQHSRLGRDVRAVLRKHVFIDTMGFNPALIRASIDLLGPANVVAGSDWPIVDAGPIQEKLTVAFEEIGLPEEQRAMVAGLNARRLLGIDAMAG